MVALSERGANLVADAIVEILTEDKPNMPDPYYNVPLFYLGYVPSAEALMVSATLPPDGVYWLPLTMCDGRPGDDRKGDKVDMAVSSWWLKQYGLLDLAQGAEVER